MAEQSIKLFASLAERYPQPEDADVAHGAARAALSSTAGGGSLSADDAGARSALHRQPSRT